MDESANIIIKMISDLVDKSDKSNRQIGELKAAMWVNFGPGTRKYSGLFTNWDDSPLAMFMVIVEFFDKKIDSANAAIEK